MSIKAMYSIRDMKAESYGPIVAYNNDGEACRALALALREKGSPISEFPTDFNLVYLGTFDDDTGEVSCSVSDHRIVCNLSALTG